MVSGRPELFAALALAALAIVLLAQWIRQRRARARLLRQLRVLQRLRVAPTEAARQIVRERDDAGARWLERVTRFAPPLRNMEELLEQAGLPWRRSAVARLGLGLAVSFALAALLISGSPLAAVGSFLVGLLLPRLYVLRRKARRLAAFEAQLPDAIDLLARAIRAGHGVTTGLRTVAEESQDPVAGEFRRVFDEQKYGLPFEESMLALTRRVDLIDLRVMVVAILVQREVGGNLTEVLDKLAGLIRTRFTLRRQLRVHTAQGRMSGYVLTLLPVVVAALLSVFDPNYATTLLQEPVGRMILASAGGLLLLGYLWIWRIVQMDL